MRLPIAVGQFAGGVEGGDAARLVAVAPLVVGAVGPERRGGGGDLLDLLEQGGLVVLDLDDQGNVGLRGDLEMFF